MGAIYTTRCFFWGVYESSWCMLLIYCIYLLFMWGTHKPIFNITASSLTSVTFCETDCGLSRGRIIARPPQAESWPVNINPDNQILSDVLHFHFITYAPDYNQYMWREQPNHIWKKPPPSPHISRIKRPFFLNSRNNSVNVTCVVLLMNCTH